MRHVSLLALSTVVLGACWTPTGTGPRSMVGNLINVDGTPLAGVSVETIESRWVTDDLGRFKVNYKEPAQFLQFDVDQLTWKRQYRPADDGHDVTLRLPRTAPRQVRCDLDAACEAELVWDLGDGLTASRAVACDRDVPAQLANAPLPLPTTAACKGADAVPVHVAESDGVVWLTPPPVPITIQLSTSIAPTDLDCTVSVNGKPAELTGAGSWTAQAFGHVQLEAMCNGVPAVPVRGYLRTPATVELPWAPSGNSLDLREALPWADTIDLFASPQDQPPDAATPTGWVLHLARGADGTFRLPQLGPGLYTVGVNLRADRLRGVHPDTVTSTDELVLVELPLEARMGELPEAAGMLVRTPAATEGPIRVKLVPATTP